MIKSQNSTQPVVKTYLAGIFSAIAIVVANMIGTGIFTTPGMIAKSVNSGSMLITLWCLGGVIAFCGALSYARLASEMPESGGEYYYLSRMYHPLLGFLSAWVSLFAGFSASIAAAAYAFGIYLDRIMNIQPKYAAVALIVIIAAIQLSGMRRGYYLLNIFTLIKILLLALLVCAGLVVPATTPEIFQPVSLHYLLRPENATSLIFISFAYAGWNASTYVAGEVKNAKRTVPISLLLGTTIVTSVYILLNQIFLRHAGFEALSKSDEAISDIVITTIFGSTGGKIIAGLIVIVLVSSVSSMIIAGSHVIKATGDDIPFFAFLAQKNNNGVAPLAIATQSIIAVVLLLTSSFDLILYYIGFSISVFSMLAVSGAIRIIWRTPSALKPILLLPPIVFLGFSSWSIFFSLRQYPLGAIIFAAVIIMGTTVYVMTQRPAIVALQPIRETTEDET